MTPTERQLLTLGGAGLGGALSYLAAKELGVDDVPTKIGAGAIGSVLGGFVGSKLGTNEGEQEPSLWTTPMIGSVSPRSAVRFGVGTAVPLTAAVGLPRLARQRFVRKTALKVSGKTLYKASEKALKKFNNLPLRWKAVGIIAYLASLVAAGQYAGSKL